jgi:hypothetical protein
MSSMTEAIVHEEVLESVEEDFPRFSKIEKMVLFALVMECDRCIKNEGLDCFETGRHFSCPFFNIRKIYKIKDIEIWKEMIK